MTLHEEQKLAQVFRFSCEKMAGYIREQVPEEGIFSPVSIRFPISGTENDGIVRIQYMEGARRSMTLGVFRRDTDRLWSNFLPSGTNEELIRNLLDPETRVQWLEQVKHLSEKADAYWT